MEKSRKQAYREYREYFSKNYASTGTVRGAVIHIEWHYRYPPLFPRPAFPWEKKAEAKNS